MEVLARVPRRARASSSSRFEGTLERFAGDGLMVFFNDPLPCPDAPAARRADGRRDARRASPTSPRAGSAGLRPRLRRRASRRATRRSAGSASRGAPTTPRSAPSPTSPRGCATRRSRADPRQPAGARRGRGRRRGRSRSASSTLQGLRRARRGAYDVVGLDAATERREHRGAAGSGARRARRGASATRASTGCRSGSPASGGRCGCNRPGRVDRRRAVDHARRPTQPGAVIQALEERILFLLLLLRQPRLRLIYVTGRPDRPERIVDYYLSPAAGRHPAPRAAPGCTWCRPGDGSPRPLTDEAARAAAPARADPRAASPTRALCHLVPVHDDARSSATSRCCSGIPMYGADPRLLPLGTKTGCRRLFAEAGVRHPLGREDLHGVDELVDGARASCARRGPRMPSAIVKLNEGVSGRGNAVVDLADLPGARRAPTSPPRSAARVRPWRSRTRASRSTPTSTQLAQRRRASSRSGSSASELPQPERAAARDAARRGRAAVDPRPAARRAERAELPRLPLPRRHRRTRGAITARGGEDRRAARARRACSAASPSTSWSCATRPAPGPRTRSSSTCARAAPRTRS